MKKKKKFNIDKAGWVAGFVVRFLSKNRELAEGIIETAFPGEHIHKNPGKRKTAPEMYPASEK